MKKITALSAPVLVLLTLSVVEGGWWKGNVHTHSNLSDGSSPPAEVAARYRDLGYDFLVLTDHNKLSDFAQYSAPGFLCIDGEEITSSSAMHVNALGIATLIPTGTYQAMVDATNAQGGLAIFNHPIWSGKGAADIYAVQGLKFMEIYNALVDDYDEPIWDEVLSMGKHVYGVAGDDCHSLYSQSGKAWVVVRAPNLTQNEILGAMNAGDFYSSTGVVLNDYSVSPGRMTVDSQDGNLIEFIGFEGAVLASVAGSYAEYQFTGSESYVRARVTNAQGKHAWTQPVHLAPPPRPTMIHGVSSAAIDVPVGSTTDAASVWSIAGSGPGEVALITPPNRADFSISIDDLPTKRRQGIMMATVRQNLRDGLYYGTVEVSHVNYFPGLGVNIAADVLQVATSRAHNGGEYNVNVAVAVFPFADGWIGGHVTGAGALVESQGVEANNVSRIGTGRYRLSIDGINSQSDGVLLAISAENGYNYLSTAPLTDGSGWEIASRDNTAATFAVLEDSRWSFVYVDYDAPDLTGGRIAPDGSLTAARGSFSLTHPSAGVYRITIPGYTPNDGILLLTSSGWETEGSSTLPADNILSYEADGNSFLVHMRDRNGSASPLEDGEFVFAFLAYDQKLMPAVPGDANYDGKVDAADAAILAQNWGQTGANWAMGDFNRDGMIDAADAAILAAQWGYGVPTEQGSPSTAVPEPSVLAMLACLVLLAGGRSRRVRSG